jgi:FtsH-binding integral membrane protein
MTDKKTQFGWQPHPQQPAQQPPRDDPYAATQMNLQAPPQGQYQQHAQHQQHEQPYPQASHADPYAAQQYAAQQQAYAAQYAAQQQAYAAQHAAQQAQHQHAQQQYAHAQQQQQHAQHQYTQHAQHAQHQYAQHPQHPHAQHPHAQHQYAQHAQHPHAQHQQHAHHPHAQHQQHAHQQHAQHAQHYQQQAPQYPHALAAPSGTRSIAGADATTDVSERVRFIRRTYLHLFGAILAFAGLSWLFQSNEFLGDKIAGPFTRFAVAGRWNWGIVLAVFMAVSWVADYWASHARSRGMQYLGLGVYVVAETLIFVPLLVIVQLKTQAILARGGGDPHILRDAAFVTLGIFSALTATIVFTKKDFSFLRGGLAIASSGALMLIVLSLAFGFNLGIVFSVAMVLLAAGYILYQTSQILAHHPMDRHVGAALALFSSVALMFWYVIRIFMRARD